MGQKGFTRYNILYPNHLFLSLVMLKRYFEKLDNVAVAYKITYFNKLVKCKKFWEVQHLMSMIKCPCENDVCKPFLS